MKEKQKAKKKMDMDMEKTEDKDEPVDHGIALQRYLDTIPLSSIQSIKNSPVLEVKAEDSVKEAIEFLYEKNVCGALIADSENGRFLDRYIGFIAISDMVFWCLEEYEKEKKHDKDIKGCAEIIECNNFGVFTILEVCPNIGQTKIAELAKSFLWQPFFPVNLDDSLFHVMLLLSKHRLQVVPVIERATSRAIGFVTQKAVIETLLRSSGLEWFNQIADKVLSKFRIENEERIVLVYGEQSIDEAFQILWKSGIGVIAVTSRENKKLIGCLRNSDVYHVLESGTLSENRKITTEEFIQMYTDKSSDDLGIEHLRLRDNSLPSMNSPVTNKKTDSLKRVMENMAQTRSSFSFLVNNSQQAVGVIMIRDVMVQFAPPCIDSSIHGDGFFECALEQTGCHVENGFVVCKH